MTYYQFVQTVEQEVRQKTGEHTCVRIHTATKNNGIYRSGLLLEDKRVNIAPTIYLEEYYGQFLRGETIEQIAEEIVILYEKLRFRRPWKEEALESYDGVKNKIVYRLIGVEKNQELLSEIPHVNYLDLAIVFYVLLETTTYGTASMMIQNHHLDIWGVDPEQIYLQARRNTWRLLPSEFKTMGTVLEELTGIKDTYTRDKMYVLSNQIRSYGASAILYPRQLLEIGQFLGEDFYVLPSSVHETLILPISTMMTRDSLRDIVTDINQTQVPEEEVLSNEVYLYDRGKECLIL